MGARLKAGELLMGHFFALTKMNAITLGNGGVLTGTKLFECTSLEKILDPPL